MIDTLIRLLPIALERWQKSRFVLDGLTIDQGRYALSPCTDRQMWMNLSCWQKSWDPEEYQSSRAGYLPDSPRTVNA